ncbi:hypothetical protein [Lysobacter sp. Root690]|uniref:hypothetical protein n=1 Tax=Lysobacter sp. Root690 TaxID=1736588 RepID=UPI0007005674|nr:hypothetical protein [Lysobacter sp. Root690]KRB08086.1 hypothetical protein ASD86_09860 [Lysobacter sp. Root690]
MHIMTQHDEQGVGAEVARAIDPGEYREHFHREFRFAAYYSAGREWPDYEPAYRYGYESFLECGDRRFEDVEAQLARGWSRARAASRLHWTEARDAVRDGWHHIERNLPHALDRPLR